MKPIQYMLEFNNLCYELWKRNDYVALYGIGGTPESEAERFEVFMILKQSYGSGVVECIPSNDISKLRKSRLKCFNDYDSANRYFHKLTNVAKWPQRVPKVVSGVEDNCEVVP